MQNNIKEYWVNVYEDENGSQYIGYAWAGRGIAKSVCSIKGKTVYRIHVKMKSVDLTPDCNKPDEVARAYTMSRERGILDGYRSGY